MLSRWKNEGQSHGEDGFPSKAHMTKEQAELSRLKAENKRLRMERDILKKGGLLRQGNEVMYRFIELYKKAWSIVLMCKVLKLSVSAYYAWRKRPEPVRKRENESLIPMVPLIHTQMCQCYGTRRMAKTLMHLANIRARTKKTLCEHNR